MNFLTFNKLREELEKSEYDGGKWVFRAQPKKYQLATTLERCCKRWGYIKKAQEIEQYMMREFKRVYDGEDRETILKDNLYCLSLLRHYGAPVRLLDFTYSKYVALYFGLECAYNDANDGTFAIWCIHAHNLSTKVLSFYQVNQQLCKHINERVNIDSRDNTSFDPVYMINKHKLVLAESPREIHKRQHLQQGVFLCPGDVRTSFMVNLRTPYGSVENPEIERTFFCKINRTQLENAMEDFKRMNITRESLFPGLDGLAESMKYQAWFYKKLHGLVEEEIQKNNQYIEQLSKTGSKGR